MKEKIKASFISAKDKLYIASVDGTRLGDGITKIFKPYKV